MTELLAPAGSREQLIAAVRSGADAVYFGAKNFNARRNAENFDDISLKDAVSYCHSRNVRVYITLNTLVKDNEISELKNTVSDIAASGVDGVLVQDLAAFRIINECCPDLPLHASTQMAVHNVSGAKMLCEMGFKRIVLARELSYKEIKTICESVDCEIEVFVHGAHCMSASGLCYMSSALGTRSGNRGLCAQPCRLNFRKDNREYALSLKDMCLIDEVQSLIDCGVASLKIEGRMKRPEYVASAVTQYRNAIDGRPFNTDDLKNVFSRSGFTKGYFEAKRNLDMFGTRTKDDVINMTSALPGMKILYKDEISCVDVSFRLTVKKDTECTLSATDGTHTVTVNGMIPQEAIRLPLSCEMAEKSLSKTGGTIFRLYSLECEIDDGITVPASELNSLRRAALDEIYKQRCELKPYHFNDALHLTSKTEHKEKSLVCSFRNTEQIFNGNFDRIILPLHLITEEHIKEYGDRLTAALPVLIYPADENGVLKKLNELKAIGLQSASADNIGAIRLIKQAGLKVIGGTRLNIINSLSADTYTKLGLDVLSVSPEASFSDISAISTDAKIGITVYGYMPLMHFRCCPMQGVNGCGDCDGKQKLTDRIGKTFTVLCNNKRYSVLQNCIPLYTGNNNIPDADFYTFKFTTETKEECQSIFNSFINGKSIDGQKTLGLYNKNLQ